MRPTSLGSKALVFYAMLLCAYFVAPYINLFFLLLTFATVLGLLGARWTWRNVSGVRGVLLEGAPRPAGCATLARVQLRAGRRPRHDLRFEVIIDGVVHRLGTRSVPAGEQRVECVVPPLPRGLHRIERARVVSAYPFGLFELRRALEVDQPVLVVHPAPADLAEYRSRSGGGALGGLVSDAGGELGPSGLREYRTGDPLRDVHWKATARRGNLVVREHEATSGPGIEVQLDLRDAGPRLEAALELLVALAFECQQSHELLSVYSQDLRATFGDGHRAFAELLEYLAAVTPLGRESGPPPAVSPSVLRLPLAERAVAATPAGVAR